MNTMVFSYGAKPPATGGESVSNQMLLAHRYRNRLVEIERDRRVLIDAALCHLHPGVPAARKAVESIEVELEAARKAMSQANAAARSRVKNPAMAAAIAEIRSRLKLARVTAKEAKAAAFADARLQMVLSIISRDSRDCAKSARAQCGIYWGTYLIVEESLKGVGSGAPPRFEHWTGEGTIGVQLQGGLSVDELEANADSRLRIGPPVAEDWGKRPINPKMRSIMIRIGSAGRDPIWARIPVVMHRPLPADAKIKWVRYYRRKIGADDEYKINFIVDVTAPTITDRASTGTVGIDLGWRIVKDGLRVAYWVGNDGKKGELIIPTANLSRWSKVESLQSIRDRNFNEARDALAAGLPPVPSLTSLPPVPEWFTELANSMKQWRSPNRLAYLVNRWRENRFAGDVRLYDAAEAWRKQDKHLWQWQAHQRVNVVRWRDDLFRNFAAMLRRRYGAAVMENSNFAEMQKVKPVEQASAEDVAIAINRRIASVARLREIVKNSGPALELKEGKNTTRKCHDCGVINPGIGPQLTITCQGCAAVWDVDENAARNLLDLGAGPEAKKPDRHDDVEAA